MQPTAAPKKKPAEVTIVKKYANRRLYNTATSVYVTLEDLCQMVKEGADFVVKDAKTSEDLTRQVLTQIIFEQESKGSELLPINFLRSVIRYYGDEFHRFLPPYLDAMMENFMQHQEKLSETMRKNIGGYSPFGQLEELSRQNMALFQQAFAAFNPFEVKK
jgi:polyhydroxyalkanoate synthesis repressor PhaR